MYRIRGHRRGEINQYLGDGRIGLEVTGDQVRIKLEWPNRAGQQKSETVIVPRAAFLKWSLGQVRASEIQAAAGDFHDAWSFFRQLGETVK